MVKWEHTYLPWNSSREELDLLGGDGWMLIMRNGDDLVFRRQLKKPKCKCQGAGGKVCVCQEELKGQMDLEDFI